MLLVDSWYDTFKGVVLLVRVFDGTVRAGDKLVSFATGNEYSVGEVGIQYPNAVPQKLLRAGQVGYVYFNPGMKRIQDAKIGDTFTTVGSEHLVEPYPGFEEPKPMVFVAAFPTDQSDHAKLADSIGQLVLNDRSITLQKDHSEALGAGWRLGFLGSLHCSVFQDRLRQEHGADIIITEPAVPTKILWHKDGEETIITNPAEFPDNEDVRLRRATISEPFVSATITLPDEYLGRVIEICENARGLQEHRVLPRHPGHPQVRAAHGEPGRRPLRPPQGRLQGLRHARLRGRRLAREQPRQAEPAGQQGARGRHCARRACQPGGPVGTDVGDQVQGACGEADV